RLAVDHALCDELQHDIETAFQKIAGGMGVVRGNIVLLRERHAQPPARQEEEFQHLNIRRQPPGTQRRDVGKVRIAAEQPLEQRPAEARFEQACRPRLLQGQRREQRKLDGGIGRRAGIERIDDVVGLAEPERQAHHEVLADVADDFIDDRVGFRKQLWHLANDPGKMNKSLTES
ncbi:hypothetical protein KXV85_005258, partial [Aspergillus fumigatus]